MTERNWIRLNHTLRWLSLPLGLVFVLAMAYLGGPSDLLSWTLTIFAVLGFSLAYSMKLEDEENERD